MRSDSSACRFVAAASSSEAASSIRAGSTGSPSWASAVASRSGARRSVMLHRIGNRGPDPAIRPRSTKGSGRRVRPRPGFVIGSYKRAGGPAAGGRRRGAEDPTVSDAFFSEVTGRIPYAGLDSTDPLAFKVYQPDRLVLGKRMEDHLRVAVCLWHSFNWPGSDVFGVGTFDRPWLDARLDPLVAARAKLDAAFEFLAKLGVPYFCFHDRDVAPEGKTWADTQRTLETVIDQIAGRMEQTGVRLLWGTANLFSHPRYAAGAATNPDPEVVAVAAAQVRSMLDATKRLGGENYVLWGGREGYETLLNTNLAQEERQLARFLSMVAEHK